MQHIHRSFVSGCKKITSIRSLKGKISFLTMNIFDKFYCFLLNIWNYQNNLYIKILGIYQHLSKVTSKSIESLSRFSKVTKFS